MVSTNQEGVITGIVFRRVMLLQDWDGWYIARLLVESTPKGVVFFFLQDWEAVVEYLMQRGEADRALPVLRRPGVSQELWYKFAPTLMLTAPRLTVDAWMTAQPPLDPPRYAAHV